MVSPGVIACSGDGGSTGRTGSGATEIRYPGRWPRLLQCHRHAGQVQCLEGPAAHNQLWLIFGNMYLKSLVAGSVAYPSLSMSRCYQYQRDGPECQGCCSGSSRRHNRDTLTHKLTQEYLPG